METRGDCHVAVSLASWISSGFGALSSATHSLARGAEEETFRLLRQPRGNRSAAYLPLLYRWKLIDGGEELRRKANVTVVVANVSNGYVSGNRQRSMLMLVSDVREGVWRHA